MSAFAFFPQNGDVASPCSSLLVTVERRHHKSSDSLASRALDLHCISRRATSALSSLIGVCSQSALDSLGELEEATNYGHRALSRYRKHGKKKDLDYSIKRFEYILVFARRTTLVVLLLNQTWRWPTLSAGGLMAPTIPLTFPSPCIVMRLLPVPSDILTDPPHWSTWLSCFWRGSRSDTMRAMQHRLKHYFLM